MKPLEKPEQPRHYLGGGVYIEYLGKSTFKLEFLHDLHRGNSVFLSLEVLVSLNEYVKQIVLERLKNEHKPTTT